MKIERLAHPIWHARSIQLAALLAAPLSTDELVRECNRQYRWPIVLTRHVMAAADGRTAQFAGGRWRRLGATGDEPSRRDGRTEADGRVEGRQPSEGEAANA